LNVFRAVVFLLAFAAAAFFVIERLPPQDSPFAPLHLDHPVGFATRMKLTALREDPVACRDAISRSALETTPAPDRSEGAFCGMREAVAIRRSFIPWSGPVHVTCPLAAALYVWEHDVVAPAASRHLGTRVTRIDHLGTYACRRVYGSATGRPSQHATANAIDVSGFRLADGRRISLARGWTGSPAERVFLREVRDGSCRVFRTVLSPDYNAAHADHFHFDTGPYAICS
jgi:hypothetical protein